MLLFWAAWLSVVTTTNILEGLRALGVLPANFLFVSGNFKWIGEVMNPLGVPEWLQAVQFGGVIAWELAAAILFWVALVRFRDAHMRHEPWVVLAVIVNMALWGAFQVLDEVFLAFGPEAVHRVIFLMAIATNLTLWVLPASAPVKDSV